jgi:hypothetical protein
MATYGFNAGGNVPFTGYTNTLGSGPANSDATTGSIYYNGLTQGDERIAKMLRNGAASLKLRRIMTTLLGAAPGSVAVETKKQIQGVQGGASGLIPIETVTVLNRATTAADVTAVNAMMFRNPFPTNYAADASGNGGGGKQQVGGGAY